MKNFRKSRIKDPRGVPDKYLALLDGLVLIILHDGHLTGPANDNPYINGTKSPIVQITANVVTQLQVTVAIDNKYTDRQCQNTTFILINKNSPHSNLSRINSFVRQASIPRQPASFNNV